MIFEAFDPYQIIRMYEYSRNFLLNAIALPPGKTKWSTGPTVRNLMEADGNSTTKLDAANLKVVSQEQVTSISPLALSPWCSFVGMS